MDVKNYLHKNSVVPVELADRGGRKLDKKWIVGDDVHITRSPNDVVLVVAGGIRKAHHDSTWLWNIFRICDNAYTVQRWNSSTVGRRF